MSLINYFLGNEDCHFDPINSNFGTTNVSALWLDTTIGHFRTGYVRYGISVQPGVAIRSKPFSAPATNFWMSGRIYFGGSLYDNSHSSWLVSFLDSNLRARIILLSNGSNPGGGYTVNTVNTSGTLTSLGTLSSTFSVNGVNPDKLDFNINYATSGSILIYINGVMVFSYTGDITTNGITALSYVQLSGVTAYNNDIGPSTWSEIIVTNLDTRTQSLVSLTPVTLGNTMDWVGSVSNINNIQYNDMQGLTSSIAGQVAVFTTTPIPNGVSEILALEVGARSVAGFAGIQHLDLTVQVNGTNYYSADQSLVPAYSFVSNEWQNNPYTSLSWQLSDFNNGATIGFKSNS